MTCVEARDQLAEFALGVLPAERATDLERHLERCAGCRKETAELRQGVATVGLSLPPASPAPALADRVVHGVFAGARSKRWIRSHPIRSHPQGSRRAVRSLATATLALALLAVGAVGWGVAERQRAESVNELASKRIQNIKDLERIISAAGGQPFQAQLIPVRGVESSGSAVIVSAPGINSFVSVDVLPINPQAGPYTVQLIDRSGKVLSFGPLEKGTSGDLVLLKFTSQNLSRTLSVTILDSHSNVLMTGKVAPYSKG
jgi:hypothetical protein